MFLLPNTHWKFRYSSGGSLRQKRKGRCARVLTTKDPHHLVFKINKQALKQSLRSPRYFALLHLLFRKYAKRFFVEIEQVSIQNDHVHLLIRAKRRSHYQSFFKVVSGQFAQTVTGTHNGPRYEGVRVWKYRPFSRVIKGYKAYQTARNYIQLNELEVMNRIVYRKERLRGLSLEQLKELWC